MMIIIIIIITIIILIIIRLNYLAPTKRERRMREVEGETEWVLWKVE